MEERRQLAKASSEEARAALARQRADNQHYASAIKAEAHLMAQQRHAEAEVSTISQVSGWKSSREGRPRPRTVRQQGRRQQGF